jgi:putative tryptophan/tyrosine transport system substrate-binding protein
VTDRRAFIGSVAAGLVLSPGSTFAQQPVKLPRIGVLGNTDGTAWDGFRRGLSELGYVDGRNVTMEWRWADGKADRYPALAAELVQFKVDLIVTSSTPATLAAKQATSSIPILMLNSAYPDKIGLVESLARPGGNITGFSNVGPELAGKKQQLLKEMVPKVSRLALFWNPANPIEAMGLRDAQAAAAVVGLEIQSIEVRALEDYPVAFAAVTAGRADALHASVNPVNSRNYQLILDFAVKNRMPSSFDERLFVVAGGLFSYGSSFADTYQRAATYADKILKGAKPADMPIQQPTKFEFVINLKTAKALGLTIPQSLLLRADEVIQ